MKVDLHVHSKYSTRPSQWVLQKLNCPETSPNPCASMRKPGVCMGLVTISDHNRIEGALSIARPAGHIYQRRSDFVFSRRPLQSSASWSSTSMRPSTGNSNGYAKTCMIWWTTCDRNGCTMP